MCSCTFTALKRSCLKVCLSFIQGEVVGPSMMYWDMGTYPLLPKPYPHMLYPLPQHTLPPPPHTPYPHRYWHLVVATEAGGTHTTGMLSCEIWNDEFYEHSRNIWQWELHLLAAGWIYLVGEVEVRRWCIDIRHHRMILQGLVHLI